MAIRADARERTSSASADLKGAIPFVRKAAEVAKRNQAQREGAAMSDDTPSPLNNVITIDDERIKSHFDRVVRGDLPPCFRTDLCWKIPV
jgi:hypothetical protein